MCTIVVKAFKNIKAIQRPQNAFEIHDPKGVNINECLSCVISEMSMFALSKTYTAVMPNWLSQTFFDPELERRRLTTHQYTECNSVRLIRKMDNLHLVDFVELELKSREGFSTAYDIALASNLRSYLEKYICLQPGHANFNADK